MHRRLALPCLLLLSLQLMTIAFYKAASAWSTCPGWWAWPSAAAAPG
jgi:hypothetical protein